MTERFINNGSIFNSKMEHQYDLRTRLLAEYQTICEPIGEYAGIFLAVTGVADKDPIKIGAGALIYAGLKGVSKFMQNRVHFNRFKSLEDKLKEK